MEPNPSGGVKCGRKQAHVSRRLPALLIVVAMVAVTRGQPRSEWFVLEEVGPKTFAAIDDPTAAQRSYSNAGFVVGDDAVIVIDTLTGDEAGGALLAAIRKVTNVPVKFVVNTHYHGDHVAGNGVFAQVGATILAHRNVRDWIHRENLRMLGPDPKPDLKLFVERLVPPMVSHAGSVDLYSGNREVQVRYFPGHTGGDSIVIVPDARVVFGGDLIWRDMVPNMIDASAKPWIATLDSMLAAYPGFTFIPGHGGVATADHVRNFRNYLDTLQALVADARRKNPSVESITKAVMPPLSARFGAWEGFRDLAPMNIAQMVDELNGKKSVPQPIK
jgi:glyoxylase-like metal-dependent hydrolase (beta-lactamase superfamily II)